MLSPGSPGRLHGGCADVEDEGTTYAWRPTLGSCESWGRAAQGEGEQAEGPQQAGLVLSFMHSWPGPENRLSLTVLFIALQCLLLSVGFCLKQGPSFSDKEVAPRGLKYGGDTSPWACPLGAGLSLPGEVGVSSVFAYGHVRFQQRDICDISYGHSPECQLCSGEEGQAHGARSLD